MPRKRRRRSVPEVLWRLFRDSARPLLDALVSSLLPPVAAPEEICRWCRGNLCLGCVVSRSKEEAKSFLLRPEDPGEYRKLMTQCFVVVHVEDPLPSAQFSPLVLCSQRQVVRRILRMDWICSVVRLRFSSCSGCYEDCRDNGGRETED